MAKAKTKITKKKNGRYMVSQKGGKKINGQEKVNILVQAGLVKQPVSKPKPVETEATEA